MIYGKIGSQYFRVLNDKDNSHGKDNFVIKDSIKYDFDDSLDENQWFYIDKFKETQLIIEFIDDGLTSAGFDQILSKDFEKIKLHKYKQQLMFYQVLCENSRDYAKLSFDGGVLQFVEPDSSGEICALEESFSAEDLARFRKLISAVWNCIINLDFPGVSDFEPNYKGMLAFEQFLVDKDM